MAVTAHRASERVRIGERINVRRQRWRVTAIEHDPGCRTLTLVGLGPHNQCEQQQLLEPFEDIGVEFEDTGSEAAGSEDERRVAVDGRATAGERPPTRWFAGPRRWRRAWREVRLAG